VQGHFGAGAGHPAPGQRRTGVIAGGRVAPVLEVAGVQDILTKCIGTSNPHNVIHATIDALQQLRSPDAAAQAPRQAPRRGQGLGPWPRRFASPLIAAASTARASESGRSTRSGLTRWVSP
jgi:hypothetical protein